MREDVELIKHNCKTQENEAVDKRNSQDSTVFSKGFYNRIVEKWYIYNCVVF